MVAVRRGASARERKQTVNDRGAQGREKLHFINPAPINAIAERWIAKFERERLTALSALKAKLEGDET